jgi:hypothetical protein
MAPTGGWPFNLRTVATVVQELVQQNLPRLTSHGASSKAPETAMMASLIAIGDEVTRKGQKEPVGDIVKVSQPSLDKQPTYTVRWRDGARSKEPYDQLAIHKKRDHAAGRVRPVPMLLAPSRCNTRAR